MIGQTDLHFEKFQLQEDGTWLNQRGGSEAIKLLADKVDYQLMLPTERKCYTYDGDLLTQVTYPNGGSFQYNYDESGLILSVRELNGKTYVSTGTDMRHSRPRG